VYLEYNMIKNHFKAMAEDPALKKAQVGELRRTWDARTNVDDVKSLSAQDIVYTRDSTGWNISADYSVKVPLFQNVNFCFDFHPSSD